MSKVVVENFTREPKRSWKQDDDDAGMRCYLGMEGRVTIADLVSHFAEHYPHVVPGDVQLNFATAVWDEPATPEDIARRDKWRADQAARTESWERTTLDRLKAKYEAPAAVGVTAHTERDQP